MSTMVVTTRVTHRYLMNKTKWDLASWIMDDFDKIEKLEAQVNKLGEALTRFAKIDLAGPVGNEIAWDILNARAALDKKVICSACHRLLPDVGFEEGVCLDCRH